MRKRKKMPYLYGAEREKFFGVTQKYLRDKYIYVEDLVHKEHKGTFISRKTGKPLGFWNILGNGFEQRRFMIRIQRKEFRFSRLLWIYMYAAIPNGYEINHLDHDEGNDLITNLDACTPEENQAHKRKNAGLVYAKNKAEARAIRERNRRR